LKNSFSFFLIDFYCLNVLFFSTRNGLFSGFFQEFFKHSQKAHMTLRITGTKNESAFQITYFMQGIKRKFA